MKSFQMELSLFIESYEYIDLKKGRKINFQRDPSKIEEIIFEDNEIEEDVTKIPVYSEIAAGMPIYINDEIEGSFYLPSWLVKSSKDTFMLKINGDSMINANIHDSDLVVIKKQDAVYNGEIVAVDINGYATIKRINIDGKYAILSPENNKYEPIAMPIDDVRIIGCAVGILKSKFY